LTCVDFHSVVGGHGWIFSFAKGGHYKKHHNACLCCMWVFSCFEMFCIGFCFGLLWMFFLSHLLDDTRWVSSRYHGNFFIN
jgi:hypothetical protein